MNAGVSETKEWPITELLVLQPDRAQLALRIEPELIWFDGHFAGHPVLPGVVQVHWAIRLGEKHLAIDGTFDSIQALKFMHVITPPAELVLDLNYSHEAKRLQFRYLDAERVYSTGRVHFS